MLMEIEINLIYSYLQFSQKKKMFEDVVYAT
jgi:hypothetical protein